MWSQAPDVERARRKRAGEGVTHRGLADRPSISSSPALGVSSVEPSRSGTAVSPCLTRWQEPTAPPPSRVVRGTKSLARETQHSPPPWGRAARTAQLPAPKLGVVDDRTTEESRPTSSAVRRRLRFDPPLGMGTLQLAPPAAIGSPHPRPSALPGGGHRTSPRAATASPHRSATGMTTAGRSASGAVE